MTRTHGLSHYECARENKNLNKIFITRGEFLLAFELMIMTRKKRYKKMTAASWRTKRAYEPEIATQIFKIFENL